MDVGVLCMSAFVVGAYIPKYTTIHYNTMQYNTIPASQLARAFSPSVPCSALLSRGASEYRNGRVSTGNVIDAPVVGGVPAAVPVTAAACAVLLSLRSTASCIIVSAHVVGMLGGEVLLCCAWAVGIKAAAAPFDCPPLACCMVNASWLAC